MNFIFMLALTAKLSGAMVTRNSMRNDEPTTLPTDLFKPLTPLRDRATSTSSSVQPENYNNGLSEAYGSYVNQNDVGSQSYDAGNTGHNYHIQAKGVPSFPGYRNGFNGVSQSRNIPQVVYHSTYRDTSVPFPYQMQSAHPAQFLARDPIPQSGVIYPGYPRISNYGTDDGNSHYQMSSRRTYFNSGTMDAPMMQSYGYNSRNG